MEALSEHNQWLALHREEIIDPDREIIDPHHHLWLHPGMDPYVLEQFRLDTSSGHNIRKTVFVECHAEYYQDGADHLRCVGETAFVAGIARESELDCGAVVAGIVAHADLRHEALEETLAAHKEAGDGRFRGIRDVLARAPEGVDLVIAAQSPKDLYADPKFQAGVRALGESNLSYDCWHYHYQNPEFLALARSAPNTQMVLDHFGSPLGVGPFASEKEAIFKRWQQDIRDIAECENVVAKLGGLSMPDNGFGWMGRETPPSSDELVAAQAHFYSHMIDCFGPDRCMFESNFPVDKLSIAYPILWNALKKIGSRYSASEQEAMFYGTAEWVYRLA